MITMFNIKRSIIMFLFPCLIIGCASGTSSSIEKEEVAIKYFCASGLGDRFFSNLESVVNDNSEKYHYSLTGVNKMDEADIVVGRSVNIKYGKVDKSLVNLVKENVRKEISDIFVTEDGLIGVPFSLQVMEALIYDANVYHDVSRFNSFVDEVCENRSKIIGTGLQYAPYFASGDSFGNEYFYKGEDGKFHSNLINNRSLLLEMYNFFKDYPLDYGGDPLMYHDHNSVGVYSTNWLRLVDDVFKEDGYTFSLAPLPILDLESRVIKPLNNIDVLYLTKGEKTQHSDEVLNPIFGELYNAKVQLTLINNTDDGYLPIKASAYDSPEAVSEKKSMKTLIEGNNNVYYAFNRKTTEMSIFLYKVVAMLQIEERNDVSYEEYIEMLLEYIDAGDYVSFFPFYKDIEVQAL